MKKLNKPFRVIIAGSRDFRDYEYLKKMMNIILSKVNDEIVIVSGTATGADFLGEHYARERGFKIMRYPAPWNEVDGKPKNEIGTRSDGYAYWKKAGHVRNMQMAENADACVVFRIKMSSGSTDMIKIAENKKLLLRYFDL